MYFMLIFEDKFLTKTFKYYLFTVQSDLLLALDFLVLGIECLFDEIVLCQNLMLVRKGCQCVYDIMWRYTKHILDSILMTSHCLDDYRDLYKLSREEPIIRAVCYNAL